MILATKKSSGDVTSAVSAVWYIGNGVLFVLLRLVLRLNQYSGRFSGLVTNDCEVGSYVAWDHCPELNQTTERDDGPILRSKTTIRDCTRRSVLSRFLYAR